MKPSLLFISLTSLILLSGNVNGRPIGETYVNNVKTSNIMYISSETYTNNVEVTIRRGAKMSDVKKVRDLLNAEIKKREGQKIWE